MADNQGDVVYLNLADVEELVSSAGLEEAAARKLVASRPYENWTDVERLSGLDAELLNGLRSRGVELGAPSSGPIGEPGSGGSADSPAGNLGRA